ncbi:Uncharacterized protein SCG7086_AH_00140 [Chlamydiales bacterium SCGC AG-110-P3]|nr:Uncharacterized protein SCG7086_AH_00140 [Chlamydiales bacterium SCGC AG-110-P3]
MISDKSLAYALLRLTLGVNIFMHGFVRLFGDYKGFVTKVIEDFHDTFLPDQAMHMLALTLPPIELIIGLMIIIGLWTRWSVAAGALVMIVLIIGQTTLMNWEIVSVQMIYSLTYFLVLFHRAHDTYSLDGWLTLRNR